MFFRGVGEVAAVRSQLRQTGGIVASVLWGVAPAAGDIVVAQDSALEVRVTIASAIVCGSAPGRLTIPAASSARGNALAGYVESPEPDDAVAAFFEDSAAGTWLTLHVASAPASGGACPSFPSVVSLWTIELREPLVVPVGTTLRFTRPLRLSLYRASDNRWYLGARDWNGTSQRFNTIQPVAGPLRPYSLVEFETGLLFTYQDATGALLSDLADTRRIASIRIVARGSSTRVVRLAPTVSQPNGTYLDSARLLVGLRNSR